MNMNSRIDLKIDKGVVIHAKTEEEEVELCKLLDNLGAKWQNGDRYTEYTRKATFKKQTCYNIHEGNYGYTQEYIDSGYKIISVNDFIKLHEQKESKEPKYRILKFQGFTSISQSDLKEQYDEWISENDYDVQNIEFSMDRNGDVRYFHAWVTYYE